jgi:glycosyltransferase involved in cell wall biosynthesis
VRILHAIHDFLPRHQAGSEVYAFDLCRALTAEHDVTVLCAEYDPARRHGNVTWRVHQSLPVVEIVNNWVCASFEKTYRPPLIGERIADVLRAVQPDVVHVHNLMNLSFDLPAVARARGVPVVATLHDYSLVCPSGGQRIHRAEQHVCHVIDTQRCARCVPESPVYTQISFGRLAALTRAPGLMRSAALAVSRRLPRLAGRLSRAARRATPLTVTARDVDARLAAARRVFDDVDRFVAPSRALAADFERLGVPASRMHVSDYGFVPLLRGPAKHRHDGRAPLRIGYVGTLVWHKGVHVLLEAIRALPRADYEVRIFGNPDVFREYTADLRARAAGLPVTFMGGFDRAHVADAYAQIDVLVVPSLWLENSPLVIHEARMAGVAVVGARIGGIAELIDDGRTGLLYDAASPAALEAALRRLLADRRLASTLGQPAADVKSIAQDAREWTAVYADVLRSRARDGRVA